MHDERMMVARDSGFGDSYYRHPGHCDDFHFATDGAAELVPISSIPLSYQWCTHCRYWLFEDGHPLAPRPEDEFHADDAVAAKRRHDQAVAERSQGG